MHCQRVLEQARAVIIGLELGEARQALEPKALGARAEASLVECVTQIEQQAEELVERLTGAQLVRRVCQHIDVIVRGEQRLRELPFECKRLEALLQPRH